MKVKLLRCNICHGWHSPFRNHCPDCGAARICVSPNRFLHVDMSCEYYPGIQIVRGVTSHNFSENILTIAQTLAESE